MFFVTHVLLLLFYEAFIVASGSNELRGHVTHKINSTRVLTMRCEGAGLTPTKGPNDPHGTSINTDPHPVLTPGISHLVGKKFIYYNFEKKLNYANISSVIALFLFHMGVDIYLLNLQFLYTR
jgi:hypothetical protein